MDGVLSQEEINALLNNNDAADSSDEILTESEKDARLPISVWEQLQPRCFHL